MKDVPPRVRRTFERLRKTEPGYIELKQIKGRYYVYRATSEWLKDEKRCRKLTSYLGSITPGGVFVPPGPAQGRAGVEA